MRMARVNISLPDELVAKAKAADLNISGLAAQAIAAELDRRAKTAELDSYLAELDVELGPVSAADQAAASLWAERAFADPGQPHRIQSA